ncbi:MAG: glucosaminidase domain-containing protein [Bacteroidales bacterium]
MRLIRIPILFVLFFSLSVFSYGQDNIELYIQKYNGLAINMMHLYNIPASVTLSIAIVESGAGSSVLGRKFHNHFGITGKNFNAVKKLGHRSKYKEYDSDTASYQHFCEVIAHKSFFHNLIDNPDYKTWVTAIGKSGYANSSLHWKKKVLSTIRHYNLQRLDIIEKDPLNK